MPYIHEICSAGRTREERKYFSARAGKRSPRAENFRPTPEAARKSNIRKAHRDLRRLMNANFEDRVDALVTLSFAGDIPEDSAGMKRMMHNFIQRLRRRYQKAGKRLKYIYCMEIGPRGSRHVHMMLSQADLQELVDAWGYGPVNVQPLWSKGQYADIAAYFIKYALKTAETEGGGKKIGQLYTPSRGLCRPKVTKTIVHARTFRESIRDRRGWRLDKNSIRRGVHEAMGTPYLEYTFVRD